MREFPAALTSGLADEVTSLAFCWRVIRADGAAIAITSHDRRIDDGGWSFQPSPGMTPSAVTAADDLEGGGMEVAGALSSGAIVAGDIADGRYDAARVELLIADWQVPGSAAVLASGRLGDIERRGPAFEAELQTVHAELARVPVELCSPECRARLGDRRCRVDLAARTRLVRVVTVEAASAVTVAAAFPDGQLANGRMRPLTGRLAGLDFEIVGSAGTWVELRDGIAGSLAAGDLVELREGCDRRFATCRDRFGNKDNFRGEPHVPGTDSIIRYPSL